MTPRLPPTKTEKHGLHIDEWWPGMVHSSWTFRKLRIRRERRHIDYPYFKQLSVAWQFWYDGRSTTVGFRIERRAPRTRNW